MKTLKFTKVEYEPFSKMWLTEGKATTVSDQSLIPLLGYIHYMNLELGRFLSTLLFQSRIFFLASVRDTHRSASDTSCVQVFMSVSGGFYNVR